MWLKKQFNRYFGPGIYGLLVQVERAGGCTIEQFLIETKGRLEAKKHWKSILCDKGYPIGIDGDILEDIRKVPAEDEEWARETMLKNDRYYGSFKEKQ